MKCFITIFISPEDGLKGLKSKQKIAEEILSKRGKTTGAAKVAKNLRRVTVYGIVHSEAGEKHQQAVDRVAKEITQATERTAVGKLEGWSPRKR